MSTVLYCSLHVLLIGALSLTAALLLLLTVFGPVIGCTVIYWLNTTASGSKKAELAHERHEWCGVSRGRVQFGAEMQRLHRYVVPE